MCISRSLSCSCSGLGSSPQGACVLRPDDLRSLPLLLAVSPRRRDSLAFLPSVSGTSSGSTSSAASVFGPLRSSAKEERMTQQKIQRIFYDLAVPSKERYNDPTAKQTVWDLFTLTKLRVLHLK